MRAKDQVPQGAGDQRKETHCPVDPAEPGEGNGTGFFGSHDHWARTAWKQQQEKLTPPSLRIVGQEVLVYPGLANPKSWGKDCWFAVPRVSLGGKDPHEHESHTESVGKNLEFSEQDLSVFL